MTKRKMRSWEMNQVQRQYIETALWSSTTDDGDPLDNDAGVDDLTARCQRAMLRDLDGFLADARELLDRADYTGNDVQAAHDFWLTRNGHGAGFWDRGLGKLGDELTKKAKAYGSFDLYLYRGKVHGA